MAIHPDKKAQMQPQIQDKVQIKTLLFNKTPTTVLTKYFNYNNIFLAKNIAELSKYIKMNNYDIKLQKSKQPIFGPIYSLRLIKLEMLKIYIKTNLANNFI